MRIHALKHISKLICFLVRKKKKISIFPRLPNFKKKNNNKKNAKEEISYRWQFNREQIRKYHLAR